jgi:hypothetical protein
MNFRDLTADEIECRVQSVKQNGLVLLLYKDARCDMKILDETVSAENWQREHYECKGNLFCRVGIRVGSTQDNPIFIWKSDCGVESNTEAQKGEASDSFKRACFNWGIGRELYTAPFIFVKSDACNLNDTGRKDKNGKPIFVCYDNFVVDSITIENKRIVGLKIYNQTKKCVAFSFGKNASTPANETPPPVPKTFVCADCGAAVDSAMAARTQKAFNVVLCKDCGLKRSEKQ